MDDSVRDAEEGRDKQRYALASRRWALNQGFLNETSQ